MAKPEKRAAAGIKRPSSFSTRKPRVSFPRYVGDLQRRTKKAKQQRPPSIVAAHRRKEDRKPWLMSKKFDHLGYDKELKELARSCAKIPPRLKYACGRKFCGKMKGYTFLRQRPVLTYIADFMCKKLKLIIEVGGYSHNFERQWYKDKERQQELEKHGCTILRFWDREVFEDIENVARVIELWIEEHEELVNTKLQSPLLGERTGRVGDVV